MTVCWAASGRLAAHEIVGGALEKCASSVELVAHGHWTFPLTNGTEFRATARIDDEWLLLESSVVSSSRSLVEGAGGASAATRLWKLLGWNAALAGGAKFVALPQRPGFRLRAELPLDEDSDLPHRIHQACGGFQDASAALHGGASHVAARPDGPPAGHADADIDLAQMCGATPWACIKRDTGEVMVDLQVPGAFHQAVVAARLGGGVVASVGLIESSAAALPADCRHALAFFLLRTCGIVRMARAAVCEGAPRLEVAFADRPCVAELAHALASLSVACRLAAREAEVLATDAVVAREYVRQVTREERGRNTPEPTADR